MGTKRKPKFVAGPDYHPAVKSAENGPEEMTVSPRLFPSWSPTVKYIPCVTMALMCGCAHQSNHDGHAAYLADGPSSHVSMFHHDFKCMRPAGICTQTTHGLHCAILPDEMKVPGQQWVATTALQGDLQSLEVRELVREGWWILEPTTFRGQVLGPVTLMKPTGAEFHLYRLPTALTGE